MESIIHLILSVSSLTWLAIGVFALAVVLHALSLHRIIKWSFRSHLWLMGSLQSVVALMVTYLAISLPRASDISQLVRILGVILLLIGLAVAVYHSLLLGWQRLMGGRFFEADNYRYDWITKGLYRYLKNPIYDGFLLIFVGLYLVKGRSDYLLLAVFSFLLLNVFLARIENKQ